MFQSKSNSAVVKIELLPQLDIFIVCKQNGSVAFFNLKDCLLISFMNEDTWSPYLAAKIEGKADPKHSLKAQDIDSDDTDKLLEDSSEEEDEPTQQSKRRSQQVELVIDEADHNLMSPLGQSSSTVGKQAPLTAKYATGPHHVVSPAGVAEGPIGQEMFAVNSEGGDHDERAMLLTSKPQKTTGVTSRNNAINTTTRTKNSTNAFIF